MNFYRDGWEYCCVVAPDDESNGLMDMDAVPAITRSPPQPSPTCSASAAPTLSSEEEPPLEFHHNPPCVKGIGK